MINKLAAALCVTAIPAAAFAEPIEMRSVDGFISVEGEVVDFNGTMLTVETSVGLVSVPASQVGCYGTPCLTLLDNNDFGLEASNFQGIFDVEQVNSVQDATAPIPVAAPADQPATAAEPRDDSLKVSFAVPELTDTLDVIAGAFMVAGETTIVTDTSAPGVIRLADAAGTSAAVLTFDEQADKGDIHIATSTLGGAGDLQYAASGDWALTLRPTQQMLGLDAFAVITPANNPVASISIAQLAGIYAGEITNWSALGGPDANILPLQLPVGSQWRDELIDLVMTPSGKTIANTVLTMADEKSIAASVNQFPGSISMVSIARAADNKALAVTGACGVTVAPSMFNIVSGDYPLLRPVLANYAQPENIPLVRALFDFASANVVQGLMARDGYMNQVAIPQDSNAAKTRLNSLLSSDMTDNERLFGAQMFQDLLSAQRLSPTMYGGPTSASEGAWNRAMFHHLAELLKSDAYEGREILFVGYANSANGPAAAFGVSRQAAAAMGDAFSRYAAETVLNNGLRIAVRGFGTLAPATCYEGQVSNNSHSRVEVWVR